MKTYNGLFEKIVDEKNIQKAILKASLGKRKKASVRRTLFHIPEVAKDLSEQLKSGTWRPLDVHQTTQINDGVELKKRYIVCPNFAREQCVHHAIMNICEPLFRKKFYQYSCGSVKGHGGDQAKKYIAKIIRKYPAKTKYVAKLDIKKFFANAKPSFIFRELRRTIRDRRVLGLFALILRANKQIVDGEIIKGGIPIGFYTSPIFANVLLNALDHYVKEVLGVEFYVRYMDDIIMFSPNKRKLKRACLAIKDYVEKIKMNLKPTWQVHRFVSVNFIGYQFKRGGLVRLRDRIFLKSVRAVRRVAEKPKPTIHDCLRILSYMGRFKHANTYAAFKRDISPYVNIRELRKRVSRHYKKLAKLAKERMLNAIQTDGKPCAA